MSRLFITRLGLVGAVLLVSACSPAGLHAAVTPTPGITRLSQLTPYVSALAAPNLSTTTVANATAVALATVAPTPTLQPSPTSTPRTHVVKAGEDLGGIAYLYHVTVADLMAANPTVNPHAMSVGIALVIPPPKTDSSAPGSEASQPVQGDVVPTPLPVEKGQIQCQRGQDGAVWCFLSIHNSQAIPMEGVSAQFSLSGSGQEPIQAPANLLLDVLPADATLPLVAYFAPQQAAQLALPLQASSQMISALPSADDGRYLPAHVEDAQVRIAADGLSAAVSLKVKLDSEGASAGRVWVAAVAYAAQGRVAGVRRWENTSASPLESGKALEVQFTVYSVGEAIERVDLLTEARP